MTMLSESLNGHSSFDIRKVRSRESAPVVEFVAATTPVTIVSSDSHVVAPPEDFINYLDPKYRYWGPTYLSDIEQYNKMFGLFGYPFPPEVLDVIDTRGAMRAGGEMGTFDPARRLREVEAEGIVAELLNAGTPLSPVPLFDSLQTLCSPELRAAGAAAHNRFLTEYCQEAPERLIGVHLIYPWPDIDAIGEQCRKAREAGGRAVYPPNQAGVPGDPTPAFYDPYWDPMWAACQDNDLVVHVHAGWGYEQGNGVQQILDAAFGNAKDKTEAGEDTNPLAEVFETFGERRPLWQLIWGGVFDRFPRLKVAFVELHGDWVPGTLAYLDRRHAEGSGSMKLSPSEYWHRNCAVGASLMRYSDVAARHEVGLDHLMFGSDYPHFEGAWPNSLDWIRATLNDIPEAEARKILGENAINFYGLDQKALAKVAQRIGPMPGDIFGKDQEVDPAILRNFEDRGGIGKSPSVREDELAASLDETIAAIGALHQ